MRAASKACDFTPAVQIRSGNDDGRHFVVSGRRRRLVPVQTVNSVLSSATFAEIQQLDTCIVSNAIERLKVEIAQRRFRLGLSAAVSVSEFSADAWLRGDGPHSIELAAGLWALLSREYELVAISRLHPGAEDYGAARMSMKAPAPGALVGELHAVIGLALNCVGYVTNGSVRDLPAVEALGFHLFAGSVAVTHQYAHVSEYGEPVETWRVDYFSGRPDPWRPSRRAYDSAIDRGGNSEDGREDTRRGARADEVLPIPAIFITRFGSEIAELARGWI